MKKNKQMSQLDAEVSALDDSKAKLFSQLFSQGRKILKDIDPPVLGLERLLKNTIIPEVIQATRLCVKSDQTRLCKA